MLCGMRNTDKSVFFIQHCWHSTRAILRKLSQKAMGFVVYSNHIHSSKVNLNLITLIRKPHTQIHSPTQYNKLLRITRLIVLFVNVVWGVWSRDYIHAFGFVSCCIELLTPHLMLYITYSTFNLAITITYWPKFPVLKYSKLGL